MANEKTIDWANYVVDDAGYVIDTYTRLSSEAATLMAHASSTEEVEDIFGDVPTIAGERSEVARMLRSMASRLRELADTLDGPVVDERDSQKIGFDASHSVAVPIKVWEYTVEDDDGEVIGVFATAAEAHEFANMPENAQAGNHAAAVASRPKND